VRLPRLRECDTVALMMSVLAGARTSVARVAFALLSAALILLVCEETAHGDALPPRIEMKCKGGTTFVHDHSGSHCVADAPTNCPEGWMGVRGGKCVLQVCEVSEKCSAGLECKSANLCGTEAMGSSYGTLDSVRSPLIAGPPSPVWMIRYSDVCSAQKTCEGTDKCVESRVCLPPDVQKPASRPANAALAQIPKERGGPDRPPVAASASPLATTKERVIATEPTGQTPRITKGAPPSVPPPGRGGAGCATSPGMPVSFGNGAGGAALALFALRRRKR
jgi:hypothetical protein